MVGTDEKEEETTRGPTQRGALTWTGTALHLLSRLRGD